MSEAERLANLSDYSGFYRAPIEVEKAMAAELRRLQAENESLRADAERYRWLRDADIDWAVKQWRGGDVTIDPNMNSSNWVELECEGLDAAIDFARKA